MTSTVFVIVAAYAPETDVAALVAVGATPALAREAMAEQLAAQDSPDQWIESEPMEQPINMGPVAKPAWRQRTKEEQETLAIAQIEEVNGCAKEIAHEMLDEMSAEEVEDMLRVCNGDDDED